MKWTSNYKLRSLSYQNRLIKQKNRKKQKQKTITQAKSNLGTMRRKRRGLFDSYLRESKRFREKKRSIRKSSCSCYSGSGSRKQEGSNTEEDGIPYPLSSLLPRLGSWSFSLSLFELYQLMSCLSLSLSLLFALLSLSKRLSFIFIVHQTEREGRRNTLLFFNYYKRKQEKTKNI